MRRCRLAVLAVLAVVTLSAHPAFAQPRPDLTVAVNQLPPGMEPLAHDGNVTVRIVYSIGPHADFAVRSRSTGLVIEVNDPPFVGHRDKAWRQYRHVASAADAVTAERGHPLDAEPVAFDALRVAWRRLVSTPIAKGQTTA